MIFLSYSGKNGQLAAQIKHELEAEHFSCFLAHDDITGGADWHDEIWAALHNCHAFVGLVTKEFNASAFCQQELGAALALNKPRLLVRLDVPDPPGFARRFQAVKRNKLLATLDTGDMFRTLRVEAWIEGAKSVDSFSKANRVLDRFRSEWATMQEDEKLRWLLAAASNGQVKSESFKAGPFFHRAKKELTPLLTDQWLFDNDKQGDLHDPDENPIGKAAAKPKKKTAKRK